MASISAYQDILKNNPDGGQTVVGHVGTGAATTPSSGRYSALEDIVRDFSSRTPSSDGTGTGYASTKKHYDDFGNALDTYYNEHREDPNLDYSKYSMFRDYIHGKSKDANDAYQTYLANSKNAMNSKVQLANIKDQTLKYVQNEVGAQGLGTQGVAQSVTAGVGNQYGQNAAEIDTKTAEMNNSNLEQYKQIAAEKDTQFQNQMHETEQANKDSAFSVATEMLNNGVELDKVLEIYGDSMTDEQKKVLQATSDSATGASNAQAIIDLGTSQYAGQAGSTYDQLKDIKMDNGKTAEEFVGHELQYIFGGKGGAKDGFLDNLTNGFTVALGNGSDQGGEKLYLVYNNGTWYRTTAEGYAKAQNKRTIVDK